MQPLLATTESTAATSLLVLAAIILLGPFLVERLGLPGIVGLVLGGAVAGESGLDLLPVGGTEALGEIGLLYLMFVAGLELDLNTVARYRRAVVSFGLTTFLLPVVLGTGVGLLIDLPAGSAVLLGSIWASHTLVAYPVAKEAGLAENRAVALSVGSTAITDTLALVVLAVVSATAAGDGGAGAVALLATGLVVLLVVTQRVLPWLGELAFTGLAQDRTLRFVLLLASLSGAAALGIAFGIEGLIGAFFAGLGLNRLVPNDGVLMDRVEFFGAALFIPAFLVFVGTQLDLAVLLRGRTIVLALAFLAVVVVGKLGAAVVTGAREGLARDEVGLMAGLTAGQAAATLAAALVAQELGLFEGDVVNAVLVAVLLSIIVSSIATAVFAGRVQPDAPSAAALGRRVLVVAGFGEVTPAAVATARAIAGRDAGTVAPVVVVPDADAGSDGAVAAARGRLAELVDLMEEGGVDAEGVLRRDTSVAAGLRHTVEEQGATLLVVPWRRRTRVAEALLGHEVDQLAAATPVPVVAGHFGTVPVGRCVVVLPDRHGHGADAEVAIRVGSPVAAAVQRPLVVWAGREASPETLPADAALAPVPATTELAASVSSGDLVIVPASAARTAVGRALVAACDAREDVSLVRATATGSLRRTTAGAPEELAGMLGYG